MVNISDICAMGGRPTALVDVLWAPNRQRTEQVWDGMRTAARDYGLPIVGGHTTTVSEGQPVYLAAAILGRAQTLLTSFDARPGDVLLMAVDLNGAYRRDKPFWNASVGTDAARLRTLIDLLPRIAEAGWCRAAKDISNGGIVGTLIMLLECSRVGAVVELAALPAPEGADLKKWLISFPSYGYLLSTRPEWCERIIGLFSEHRICCQAIGEIREEPSLEIRLGGDSSVFWRHDGHGDSDA